MVYQYIHLKLRLENHELNLTSNPKNFVVDFRIFSQATVKHEVGGAEARDKSRRHDHHYWDEIHVRVVSGKSCPSHSHSNVQKMADSQNFPDAE